MEYYILRILLIIALSNIHHLEPVKTIQVNRILERVYVPDVLNVSVMQQPNSIYISSNDNEVTQMQSVKQFGNIGLVAHSSLAGKYFSSLAIGQKIQLIYDNGMIDNFIVTEILKYQALQPMSVSSDFRDLNTDEIISARELFNRVYEGEYHLTFQTCISGDGKSSWGRLFVIAIPIDKGL